MTVVNGHQASNDKLSCAAASAGTFRPLLSPVRFKWPLRRQLQRHVMRIILEVPDANLVLALIGEVQKGIRDNAILH